MVYLVVSFQSQALEAAYRVRLGQVNNVQACERLLSEHPQPESNQGILVANIHRFQILKSFIFLAREARIGPVSVTPQYQTETDSQEIQPFHFQVVFSPGEDDRKVQIEIQFVENGLPEFDISVSHPNPPIEVPHIEISHNEETHFEFEGSFLEGDWNSFLMEKPVWICLTKTGKEDFDRQIGNLLWLQGMNAKDEIFGFYEAKEKGISDLTVEYKHEFNHWPYFVGTKNKMTMRSFRPTISFQAKWRVD